MWCWRRLEKISYKEKMTNEKVLEQVKEKTKILKVIVRKKNNRTGHVLRGDGLLKEVIEG